MPDELFVIKRTDIRICDLDALLHLIANSPKRQRPLLGLPISVWREGDFMIELQRFIEGPTLGRLVMRNRVPVAHGALMRAIVADLTDELHWLRDIDLVHRDVTPFNIVLGANGPVLVDWSFCSRPAHQQVPVSTPGFTAPEQLTGQATHKSDWFGFAATLAFLATGDGRVQNDPRSAESLSRLPELSTPGFKFYYRLDNGRERYRTTERLLIQDLLTERAEVEVVDYEPASTPVYFEDTVEAFRVLEVEPGAHLAVGNEDWFRLPHDGDRLARYLLRLYQYRDRDATSSALFAAIKPINPQLASVLRDLSSNKATAG